MNSLSPAAMATCVDARTSAAPRRSSALTGSSNQRTSSSSMPAAKRLASATLNVPWASTITSTPAPSAARAAATRATLASTVPSITPTRIFTAPNPADDVAPQLVADAVGVGPAAAGVQGHVAAARPSPQVDDRRSEGTAEEVPEGHVDATHRRHGQPSPPEDGEDPAAARRVAGARPVVHAIGRLVDPAGVASRRAPDRARR